MNECSSDSAGSVLHFHIFTNPFSRLDIYTYHLHILSSSHLHISSCHLHVFTSSHLHVLISFHLHIFTSSLSLPLSLFLSRFPSPSLSLSLSFFSFLSLGRGRCLRGATKLLWNEMAFNRQKLNLNCNLTSSVHGNHFARNEVRSSKTRVKLQFNILGVRQSFRTK